MVLVHSAKCLLRGAGLCYRQRFVVQHFQTGEPVTVGAHCHQHLVRTSHEGTAHPSKRPTCQLTKCSVNQTRNCIGLIQLKWIRFAIGHVPECQCAIDHIVVVLQGLQADQVHRSRIPRFWQ